MLYELDQFAFEAGYKSCDDDQALIILTSADQILLNNSSHFLLELDTYAHLTGSETTVHFIGRLNNKNIYTTQIELQRSLEAGLTGHHLRQLLPHISETYFSVLSRALQVNQWWMNHQFCGRCGGPTTPIEGELALSCHACEQRFYPRISPCIIVLIHREREILLARNALTRYKDWFSTLAGFIECGESAEQAVHREVREEVDISVKNLRYKNSQSWPFPNQLMLGFFAEYADGEIKVDGEEIIEAAWWPIDNLPKHSPPVSIAGWLINQYIQSLSP